MPAVSACWSLDYSGTDGYHAIGLLRKTSKLFANSEEPGICQRAFSMASTNVSRSAIAVMRKLLRPQWSLGSRNKKTKRAIDGRALFEVYLWRFMMETLRNRRNVPESSSKTSSLPDPRRTRAFRVLAGPNHQIASRFVQSMVCQRYSPGTISTCQRVTGEFLEFWGNARLFRVSHLDVR